MVAAAAVDEIRGVAGTVWSTGAAGAVVIGAAEGDGTAAAAAATIGAGVDKAGGVHAVGGNGTAAAPAATKDGLGLAAAAALGPTPLLAQLMDSNSVAHTLRRCSDSG